MLRFSTLVLLDYKNNIINCIRNLFYDRTWVIGIIYKEETILVYLLMFSLLFKAICVLKVLYRYVLKTRLEIVSHYLYSLFLVSPFPSPLIPFLFP